ncbi:DNA-directed DNA polymerase [Sarracenia purpurea var. burkii]
MYGYRGSEHQMFVKLWLHRAQDVHEVFALLDSELYQRRLRWYMNGLAAKDQQKQCRDEAAAAAAGDVAARLPMVLGLCAPVLMFEAAVPIEMRFSVELGLRPATFYEAFDYREVPAEERISHCDVEIQLHHDQLRMCAEQTQAGRAPRHRHAGYRATRVEYEEEKKDLPAWKQAKRDLERLSAELAQRARHGTSDEELEFRVRQAQRYSAQPGSAEDTDPIISVSCKVRRRGQNEQTRLFAQERTFCFLAPGVPRPEPVPPNVVIADSEVGMAQEMFRWLHDEVRPDKYKTWNGSNFDFWYLYQRLVEHHRRPDIYNWGLLRDGRSDFYTKLYSTAAAGDNTIGVTTMDLVTHDDLMIAWQRNFKAGSYSLNAVAGSTLRFELRDPETNEVIMEQITDPETKQPVCDEGDGPR